MSFFDVDKIAKDAADKIVERVVRNLTAVVEDYKESFDVTSDDLTKDLLEAKDGILGGFDKISEQLRTITIILYVLLGLVSFIFVKDLAQSIRGFVEFVGYVIRSLNDYIKKCVIM